MPEVTALVPLYNHAGTIEEVLRGIADSDLSTIVVDDGSTDGGAGIAERWFTETGARGEVVRLGKNRGKAAAIAAGLEAVGARGGRFALTIDADGQHDTTRIPEFIATARAAEADDRLLVLGDRRPLPRDYPLARLVGRTLSGLAVRAACGVRVGDAACGMRLYDVGETLRLRCLGGRYAWEEEAIVRLAWRGTLIRQVAVPVIYRDRGIAASHYRFRRDWTEGTGVLLASILLRIVDPRARWSREGAPLREIAWPLLSGDGWTPLLAIAAAGIAAVVTAAAHFAAEGTAAGVLAGVPLAIALIRTRSPAFPAVLGALAGWWSPLPSVLAAIPVSLAWMVVLIARTRGQRALP